jgi:dolichol-phosphate mannosyltransferase
VTRVRRIARFYQVGFMGAVLQLLLVGLGTAVFHLAAVIAMPIAVETAVLHNYLWHERFTWRDRRVRSWPGRILRMGRFQAVNGTVSLAGNTALAYWFVDCFHVPAIPSAIASMALCSLINFVVADRWVYDLRCPEAADLLSWNQ